MNKLILTITIALLLSNLGMSQTNISGVIVDQSGQGIPGVNIVVLGTNEGVSTNLDGRFDLKTTKETPFQIKVQNLGYQTKILDITNASQNVHLTLVESNESLDEIVISASRTPERIRESPITIERMGILQVKNTSSANFYEGLENLKGVHSNANSLTFKSINTRGFATFANTRFVQLLDGQDVASPALNFPTGNIVGVSDLDVASVELIPGAASALYGANAFNGMLFINTKNPFDFQGISFYVKPGISVQEEAGSNGYGDIGLRFAKAFNNKFAIKVNFGYLKGTDWKPNDVSHQISTGGPTTKNITRSDNFYNGLNIYGDEISPRKPISVAPLVKEVLISQGVQEALIRDEFLPNGIKPSRDGYHERDLVDNYTAKNLKFDAGLYYKLTDKMELSWTSRVGSGSSVYQGSNRYALRNFQIHLHKLELRGKNFFVRGYGTFENSGDTYDTRFTGIYIQEAAKPSNIANDVSGRPEGWFPDYTRGFVINYARELANALLSGQAPNKNAITEASHKAGRALANSPATINGKDYPGVLKPGTDAFISAFNAVTSNANIEAGGSKFKDKTNMYHFEGNYNFNDIIDFADILIGGSYRRFLLNSFGTIFSDKDERIVIAEYASYLQITKKFWQDKLKLLGSARIDKSKNFDISFSPRISAVLSLGEQKNHNIRASFQTGFRNPDTQPQYIALNVGNAILLGTTEDNLKNRYKEGNITGQQIFESALNLNGTPFKGSYVKQEEILSFEIGYRGSFADLEVDFNMYRSEYTDFSVSRLVFSPLTQKVYQLYGNADDLVFSNGIGLGLSYNLKEYYRLSGNYTWQGIETKDSNSNLEYGFNAPNHSVKLSFGTRKYIKGTWGFSLDYRWTDSYYWESSFADGPIDSRTIFDAQISYNIPNWYSIIKLGGSNIFNNEYTVAPGTGKIGSIYYLSWTTSFGTK